MNLILYAIPFFFLLIFIELTYGYVRGQNTYRLNDSINSLSLGTLSRLQGLVVLGFSGVLYELVVLKYQLTQLPNSTWVWILCFVAYDFVYYWKHRLGHEVALFWGSHVAHHQSEDYNLTTALRQTSIDFHGFIFYLPFFFLGFPAEILFTVVSLNLIYQFWVHTEHVPKLGLMEWVFVTPSNHRVHHARNKSYVDKNYGGVFIVWDRLFGSFQEEKDDEPAVFGLRKPLNSWNPIWANVHVYWRLLLDMVQSPGLANKIKILIKPPGWQPEGMVTQCKNANKAIDLTAKFNPSLSRKLKGYVLVQYVLVTTVSLHVLIFSEGMNYNVLASVVIALAFNLYGLGALMENRLSNLWLEVLRLGSLTGCCLILFSAPLGYLSLFVAAISLLVVSLVQKEQPETSPA